MDPRLD
eukprot:CCRYP_011475-RC/>CCRYP_011475-RC protein AED:0.49 eAED:0.49 QI:0/-1/0/1/-1/0/1/0/6